MMDFLMVVYVLFIGGGITIGVCCLLADWIADWQD